MSIEQLNASIDSRIAHMKHSALSEEEKKHELQKISHLIRFRDQIEMKKEIKDRGNDNPNRIKSLRVPGPLSQKEKEELYVLIDSV